VALQRGHTLRRTWLTILARLDERLELDYTIAEDLKDRVIPHAVDYFTGKALAYEDDGA
jgi:hypothetical protein